MNLAGLFTDPRPRTIGFALCWALLVAAPAAALPQDLSDVGRAEFPNDDAVILRLHQGWTLRDDGSAVYEEHRFVKLLDDRAWRRYADPRVDYLEGFEEVELITALTYLPDGTTLGLPDYSTTVVSPFGIYKWPTFAGWRQMIYIFSGVENGAVLELHYKRTSKPGTRRWLEADLRIGEVDPVVERVVEVTLPGGAGVLNYHWVPQQIAEFNKSSGAGNRTTYRWTLKNIPADPDEAHCPPWRQRCGRLWFTNCPSAEEWVADLTRAIESSVQVDDVVRKFAEEASKNAVDEAGKVRAVAKKLRDTFNFVDDARGWMGRRLRPTGEVFDSCFGSRLESAAVMLAALRSLGLEAQARIAVERNSFAPEVPTDTDLAAVVIEVPAPGGTVWLEPSAGVINPNSHWRDRDVLYVENGRLQQFAAFATESSQPDAARVRGVVKLDEKAEKLTGQLNIELTGLFVNPENLRDDKKRHSRIESIVSKVLPDMKVTDSSVSHLSQHRFVARASVESKKAPTEVYSRRLVTLASSTPALAEAHLPLDRSKRRTPIQLPGHLTEELQLTIELPDGWKPAVLPEPLHGVSGDWGRIAQTVETGENLVRIERQVAFNVRVIRPDDFATIRQAVRTLQSEACRTLLLEAENP